MGSCADSFATSVGTGILRIGRTSYTLGQAVFSGDVCAAAAEVVTVYMDPDKGGSTPLPDALRDILGNFQIPIG